MIRFEPVPKPANFDTAAGTPGATWLAQNAAPTRPTDLWSPFRADLADGFRDLCGYTAMHTPNGTVDHFVSCHEDRSKAYDWSNYRFAAGWVNSSKQNLKSSEIFDPFAVQDGWFEIILPSLQLVASSAVPEAERERAAFVLRRLRLGHDERVMRQRREWYRMYQDGELTLEGLRKKAPLIAAAVEQHAKASGSAS
jgi:hypothetical protein